jgi:transposase
MCMRRVDMDRLQELVRLHRLGTGGRETARLLKMGPNTEREYRNALATEGLLVGPVDELPELAVLRTAVERQLATETPAQMTSSVADWESKIIKLAEAGLTAQPIFDRLKLEEPDFSGGFYAVRAVWRRWKKKRPVSPDDIVIPVETVAGDVAQVDFGYVGKLYDPKSGRQRKAWVFVMVLGYSRWMFAKVVFDQKVETWLKLHIDAFTALGGVPGTVVPDNLKAAVVRAAFAVDDTPAIHRSYRELARYYGFKIDPTPVCSPDKKGRSSRQSATSRPTSSRVERVPTSTRSRRSSCAGSLRSPTCACTAPRDDGRSTCSSTKNAPLSEHCRSVHTSSCSGTKRVHTDCHVAFGHRLYSVPWTLRRDDQKVWIRATPKCISIYANDERVADHDRRGPGPRSTIEAHLPEERAPWRHRSRDHWQERADRIAPEVGTYVRELFDADDVLHMLRVVQSTVTHLEKFPRERAIGACLRAQHFGSRSYGALKNILRQGLDLQPLPTTTPTDPLPQPRFASSMSELLHTKKKDKKNELN